MTKKVSLALSSGGARGLAHIGVIRELEDQGIEIAEISGSSMGAVVGGIYAAGHLDAYEEWMCNLDRSGVFKLLDFTLSANGFIKGERVFEEIKKFAPEIEIENLRIPFRAVAVDVRNHQEVVLDSGDLYTAMRASVAIPTVLKPLEINGKLLVDGGVTNPIPLSALRNKNTIRIAVNLNANNAYDQPEAFNQKKQQTDAKQHSMLQRLFQNAMNEWFSTSKEHEGFNYLQLLNNSFDMMQERLTEAVLKLHKPEVLINISKHACNTFDFYKAEELIAYGRAQTKSALQTLNTWNQWVQPLLKATQYIPKLNFQL